PWACSWSAASAPGGSAADTDPESDKARPPIEGRALLMARSRHCRAPPPRSLAQPGDAAVGQAPGLPLLAQRGLGVDGPIPADAPVVRGVRTLAAELPLYRRPVGPPRAVLVGVQFVQRADPPVGVADEQHLARDVGQVRGARVPLAAVEDERVARV